MTEIIGKTHHQILTNLGEKIGIVKWDGTPQAFKLYYNNFVKLLIAIQIAGNPTKLGILALLLSEAEKASPTFADYMLSYKHFLKPVDLLPNSTVTANTLSNRQWPVIWTKKVGMLHWTPIFTHISRNPRSLRLDPRSTISSKDSMRF